MVVAAAEEEKSSKENWREASICLLSLRFILHLRNHLLILRKEMRV